MNEKGFKIQAYNASMIGRLQGEVAAVIRDTVVVLVGGVGYRVRTLASVLANAREGTPLTLWTHLAVREHAHELFGFERKEELQWFELLLTVSGIGPRSALAVLNSADLPTLESAITGNDPSILARAFGIGRKTSEKIVLELKEKVVAVGEGTPGAGSDGEVVEALVSLGYSLKEARDAARAVPKEVTGAANKIREALRLVSPDA